MIVTQYTFQSPYSSQVQVGRPDPSAQKADDAQQASAELMKNTNSSLSQAQSFQSSQTQEVTPTVSSSNHIDIYV
ncbi:MAG: hypothetical protein DRG78_12450 [Epsilonproteobacteria bacterium]|nr:MAG: hypothetical protein DRG78_12450 [Campylobacterota bacterium]